MSDEANGLVQALGALTTIAAVFSNIADFIGGISSFLLSLGVTQAQALAAMGVAALVSFIFVLEFMQQISKLLILLILLWIAGSLLGFVPVAA